jgi:hypothetical protein
MHMPSGCTVWKTFLLRKQESFIFRNQLLQLYIFSLTNLCTRRCIVSGMSKTEFSTETKGRRIADRIIHKSVRLHCDPKQAFEMFTVNKHLESWLTTKAEVEPNLGGKYELFWNPTDRENDSTVGCRIT